MVRVLITSTLALYTALYTTENMHVITSANICVTILHSSLAGKEELSIVHTSLSGG